MQRSAAAPLRVLPDRLARQSCSSSHRIGWRSLQKKGDVERRCGRDYAQEAVSSHPR
jgi:hypothetical protein